LALSKFLSKYLLKTGAEKAPKNWYARISIGKVAKNWYALSNIC
jgi:hypothetical protein